MQSASARTLASHRSKRVRAPLWFRVRESPAKERGSLTEGVDRGTQAVPAVSGEPECVHQFHAHTSTLSCVAIHEGFLYTGSFDRSIKKWDWQVRISRLPAVMGGIRCG